MRYRFSDVERGRKTDGKARKRLVCGCAVKSAPSRFYTGLARRYVWMPAKALLDVIEDRHRSAESACAPHDLSGALTEGPALLTQHRADVAEVGEDRDRLVVGKLKAVGCVGFFHRLRGHLPAM